MATSYHQLGVSLKPGGYEAAEAWYRQALAIFERVGNQAGTVYMQATGVKRISYKSGRYLARSCDGALRKSLWTPAECHDAPSLPEEVDKS
jgi:hypothetical protein